MDIPTSLTAAGRKAPRNQPLRAARPSPITRKRFWQAFGIVALGLILVTDAVMLIQIHRNKINLDQAAVSIYTARITRPLPDGTFCRNAEYDNKTDYVLRDTISRCVPERSSVRPPLKFNWGR
jgi:hypothetical protein